MTDLPPLRLSGAHVLRPDGLARDAITLADGRITDGPAPERDLTGYILLPGIVDLHGDGFERHLAPRRGALESLDAGLLGLDAELAANGITTAVLAQFFSWEGGMRGPDFAERVAEAVSGFRGLTDLRMQLRLEVNMVEDYPRALALVEAFDISFLVFNDHLPHDALASGKKPPGLIPQALKAARSPELHEAYLHRLHAGRDRVATALPPLAATLKARGVRLGSHDDTTAEDRARYRALGADIAEFPETRAAAEAAHAAGEPVLMGAPNVVRGASHKKNQPARDLIEDGLVTALVSDYHYPAPHRAALKLIGDGIDWPTAWGLISGGPASVLGLDDRGHLSPGLRADLTILNADTRIIEGTIAAGRISYLSGGLAARMVAS